MCFLSAAAAAAAAPPASQSSQQRRGAEEEKETHRARERELKDKQMSGMAEANFQRQTGDEKRRIKVWREERI